MSNLNIRVDDQLKKQVEVIFSDLGISLSAAITIFLKQVVRCNGIPFELKADPFYSAKNRMEQTGGTVHELIEVESD